MILLLPDSLKSFPEYGISIPVAGSRAMAVLSHLSRHETLGRFREQWLSTGREAAITREDLVRTHDPAFIDLVLSDHPEPAIIEAYELVDENGRYRRFDPAKAQRPLRDLVGNSLANVSGTYQSGLLALEHGFCFFLGGGMHHAMSDKGRGFCLLNDIVISVRKLRHEGIVRRVWIIDTDAHRADGTAELCVGDEQTMTLSIHMAAGWPLDGPPLDGKGRLDRSRYPSTVDIPIPAGGEEFYLDALEHGLRLLWALSLGQPPDLAIVVAGSDPYEEDELPSTASMRLNLHQMFARDMFVYDWLLRKDIPQSWLMAGGYGRNSWKVYAKFLTPVLLKRYAPSSDAQRVPDLGNAIPKE
jgi:acetoin utilization deacetylase AcuC-like enzyme